MAEELSIEQRIMAIMDRDEGGAPEEEKPQAPAAEQAEEAPSEEVKKEEPVPEEPVEQKAALEIPLDQLEEIELEIAEGEKLKIGELKKGYLRQSDYTKKTQEVAAQRAEAENLVKSRVEAERTQYQAALAQLSAMTLQTMEPELKEWFSNPSKKSQLAAEDPATFVRLSNREREIREAFAAIEAQQKAVESKKEAERRQSLQESARKAREELESSIPNWSETLVSTLRQTAEKVYGLKPDEIDGWTDARMVKMLHDAHQYRAIKDSKPSDKKVVPVPKVVKPGATQNTDASAKAEAFSKLRKSGRLEDAAQAIMRIM